MNNSNTSDHVNQALELARKIFVATEEALEQDWDRKENLQFPNLFTLVVKRLQADEAMVNELDPYMRSFVRNHPKYHVSRGAKGGIMLRSVYEARMSKKSEVEKAKKDIVAAIDAKIAAAQAASAPISIPVPVVVPVVDVLDSVQS